MQLHFRIYGIQKKNQALQSASHCRVYVGDLDAYFGARLRTCVVFKGLRFRFGRCGVTVEGLAHACQRTADAEACDVNGETYYFPQLQLFEGVLLCLARIR
jgi:hypothetical protein